MRNPSYQTILVALDGTRFSEAALKHAESIARNFGAQLHLVRALAPAPFLPPQVTYFGAVPLLPPFRSSTEQEQQRKVEEADQYLADIKERLEREDLRCSYATPVGEKKEVILEEAARMSADMIVIASHQRSGLARFLAPNTCTLIALQTECPVLSVKGDPAGVYREEHLYERIQEKVAPHYHLLAEAARLEQPVAEKATPPAIAMILAALAEERRRGPDLRSLIQQLRFYKNGADDVAVFLSEGHSGPDVGLVAHVFNERGAKAAAVLADRVEDLTSDGAVSLLAFLSPIVLAELSLLADDDSELKRLLREEVAEAEGRAETVMDKASELVHSV